LIKLYISIYISRKIKFKSILKHSNKNEQLLPPLRILWSFNLRGFESMYILIILSVDSLASLPGCIAILARLQSLSSVIVVLCHVKILFSKLKLLSPSFEVIRYVRTSWTSFLLSLNTLPMLLYRSKRSFRSSSSWNNT